MPTEWKTRVKAVEADTADALANKIEKLTGNPKFLVQAISEPYFAVSKHIVIVTVKEEITTP